MQRDFWHNSTVAVIGAGSWGTVLANLIAKNCAEVLLWARDEDRAREVNSTRTNRKYFPEMTLSERVHAYSGMDRIFAPGKKVHVIVWALPAKVCRPQARFMAPFLSGDEIVLHATKGIEEVSLKRVSEVLREELPTIRIGVISGPNLSNEIAKSEPAATVVASSFDEVVDCGKRLLAGPTLRVYGMTDMVGVEWGGTLKNIYAIAAGALDSLGYGWNARAMLMTRSIAEMVRFGVVMGAKESTFLGLAGIGDLLATASSPLSRNYRVGALLAKGDKIGAVLEKIGSTAEGVRTAEIVAGFARERGISMPIAEAVDAVCGGRVSVQEALKLLMTRPQE